MMRATTSPTPTSPCRRAIRPAWTWILLAALGCNPPPGNDDAARADNARAPDAASHDWLIVPDERVGPVTRGTSEADLLAAVGDSLLATSEVYLAEGVCTDGAVLYPGTADRLDITWADSAHTHPATLRTDSIGARWHTADGIRIGTSLKELETIAGDVVTFSGFGWDYGGGMNWGGADAPYRMSLRLQPDSASWQIVYADPNADDISGDRPVRSDNPLIRRLNITVAAIIIGFDVPHEEHDCRAPPRSP